MMGQWITNPSAMGTSIAIHGPPGSGKCHGIDTPILMYNGTIKMIQDVIIGDVVMGDDSNPRNVLWLGQGQDKFKVVVDKKDKIVNVEESIHAYNDTNDLTLKIGKTLIIPICLFNSIQKYSVVEYGSLPDNNLS